MAYNLIGSVAIQLEQRRRCLIGVIVITGKKTNGKRQQGVKVRKSSSHSKTSKSAPSAPSNTHILVLGRRRLHNQLLRASVESETGVRCTSAHKAYKLTPNKTAPSLTSKETEILLMVSKGASNRQIAKELGIKQNTVKGHLYHIYKKLKVSNRVQASIWASKHLNT